MYRQKCNTLGDTKALAYKFANLVKDSGCFVNLFGEIGAGKTAFVKLVAEALGIKEKVTSPSFVYLMNITAVQFLSIILIYTD